MDVRNLKIFFIFFSVADLPLAPPPPPYCERPDNENSSHFKNFLFCMFYFILFKISVM